MNRLDHLLWLISEESNELAQRASKAARFGINEIQEGQKLTNYARLKYEANDLLAVLEMLCDELKVSSILDGKAIKLKKEKVEKYLEYSRKLGLLE